MPIMLSSNKKKACFELMPQEVLEKPFINVTICYTIYEFHDFIAMFYFCLFSDQAVAFFFPCYLVFI